MNVNFAYYSIDAAYTDIITCACMCMLCYGIFGNLYHLKMTQNYVEHSLRKVVEHQHTTFNHLVGQHNTTLRQKAVQLQQVTQSLQELGCSRLMQT